MTDDGHLLAGRYRLLRRIGAGAMGVVWQGHDERLDRPVAIKKLLLRPGLPHAKAAEAIKRCLREGRIAARLHHPNAITVFDVVDEDNVPNLVMEYLPSRSLAAAVDEGQSLAPEAVAAIGAQVATALAAAHDAGIVHRDITPGNVLLGEDGSVKLADFGISRAVDDDVAKTKTSPFAGTPAYLAPEVAHGTDPTPASDVFSLGATLYAALEGQPPFGRAPNVLALLHTVAGGEIIPPRRSGPLTDVLLALLETDPQARPTAAQASALLAAATATPLAAPTEAATASAAAATETIRPRPAAPGRSPKPLAAAGVVVALAAGVLWLLGSSNTLTPPEQLPPDGKAPQQPAQTTDPAQVTPVGEPIDIGRSPAAKPSKDRPAPQRTSAEAEAEAPAATNAPEDGATAPPPVTTSDQVDEPVPSDTPTEPPTSTEQAPTEPS